jgi:hypothetical protein
VANTQYAPVAYAGSDMFRKRGVSVGDAIYIISQKAGQLLLGGRMTVGEIVSRQEAVQIRNRSDLYHADEWIIGKKGSGTPLHRRRQLSPEITRQLRFVSGNDDDGKELVFVNNHDLDGQTTRGVRQLTFESAELLDEIIEFTDAAPSPNGSITISKKVLRAYRSERDLASAFHEEVQADFVCPEGSLKQVLVNRYERDPLARDACIRHHGAVCSVCGFDFGDVYGEVAAGFIHVHHLIPLSRVGSDYVVNPIQDLRPVCPNCHATIHCRTPPFSIEDVRDFLGWRRSVGK